MSGNDFIQLVLMIILLYTGGILTARHMERVFTGKTHFLKGIIGAVERAVYRICGIDPNEEMSWKQYAFSLLAFSAANCVLTYLLLRLQHHLPLNPQSFGKLAPDLALNTTIGYNTNSSWQSFSGESTMSYFSQMVPLLLQYFLSPAIGAAAAVAVVRGLIRTESPLVGCFWSDLIRSVLYLFLPISFVFAVFLVSQGVIHNVLPYSEITTLEGAKQLIAQGPAAAQVAMKLLGTNGGGFFNANSAHPFENPTPLCNFVQIFMMLLIPSAFPFYLGFSAKKSRHGHALWVAMALVFALGVAICAQTEYRGNPLIAGRGAISSVNLEGKEARFGTFNSAFFTAATTASGTGAVNSSLDSFTPLGGLIPLVNMLTSEVIFGGVGSGIYGMIVFVLVTIFITGLMVGRTPDYLGKKIEAREMKFAMIAMIVPAFLILAFSAMAAMSQTALASIGNPHGHGFSEVLYDYTSATMNNGSTFAGLSTNTPFWNLSLAFVLFTGRYFTMIPVLAIAGSMANKKSRAESENAFSVEGILFVLLLIAVIFFVGALTFFPALALGPVAEHFEMLAPK